MVQGRITGGMDALRRAVAEVMLSGLTAQVAPAGGPTGSTRPAGAGSWWLLSEAAALHEISPDPGTDHSDREHAVSSMEDEAEASRMIALVELARGGDTEAFGM